MRLNTDPRLPQTDDMRSLKQRLYELFRDVSTQVNATSEGMIQGATNAATVAPTEGKYAVGDFVRNIAPAELGAAGSKYVITGWLCVAAPLTFVETRALTGH
jgi:hypothetical protein